MRNSAEQQENEIPIELLTLYQRIETNAQYFGMCASDIDQIKKECKIAFQHKKILDKVSQKKA